MKKKKNQKQTEIWVFIKAECCQSKYRLSNFIMPATLYETNESKVT